MTTSMKSSLEPAFDGRRVAVATAVVGAFLSILVVRLYVLQIIKGEEYVAKSQVNFVQERRIAHARGLIMDQGGRVLVDNRPSHDVYMTVAFLPDSTRTLQQLLRPLELDRSALKVLDAAVVGAVEAEDDRVVLVDGVERELCDEIEAIAEGREGKDDPITGVRVERSFDDDTCRVVAYAKRFPSRTAVFRKLRELVGLPRDDMQELVQSALKKSQGLGRFKPTNLLEDIGFDAYARVEAAGSLGELPGIDVVDSQKRRYRSGALAAHVNGYMNEIGSEELKKHQEAAQQAGVDSRYFLGDLIGRTGVEASHELELRGKDGIERVVVDAKGRAQGDRWATDLLGEDRITPPSPGRSLVLSLDLDMQQTAEDAFGGVRGSVVALEVETGFVLAMASIPDYDPNLVSGPWSKDYKRQLTADKNKPWMNKAIQGQYAPGSTFKAITAAAGLRNQLIDEDQKRACPGFFRLGRSTWRCFNRGGHGPIALVRALQFSCDSYFYSLGYELGPDRLAETGRLFGFGHKTGIDLEGEAAGNMPDRAYYVKRLGAYTPGLVVNNSIGQGDVNVTPLQLAMSYAAIANGGKIYQPQLVREVRDEQGKVLKEIEPKLVAELGVDKELLDLMKESLAHVTDPGGTASGLNWRRDRYADMSTWLRESGIKLVGKTGTAQVVRLSKSVAHVKAEDVAYEQRDHAWFVAFAPYDKPEIVVVTMTEHGGFGGSTSGPVVGEVMRTWFERVRGHGRFAHYPPLPPRKKVIAAPPKKPDVEDEAPPTAIAPEEDEAHDEAAHEAAAAAAGSER